MAGRQEERNGSTATDTNDTESYVVRNGRLMLHENEIGCLSDEDGLYVLMEGKRHPSGEFEDSASDDDISISAQPYRTDTPLKKYRTELGDIEDEGMTDQHSIQIPNGIGEQDRVRNNTRNTENRRELADEKEDDD